MKNSTIKKQIGGSLFNFLTRNFSGDFLAQHLPEIFLEVKNCRKIQEKDYDKVKLLLNERYEGPEDSREKDTRTAIEILDGLGYELIETKSKAEYLPLKKYYAKGEQLCKLNAYDACKRYGRLFWFVVKDIDDVRREDYAKPSRQDKYSTSLLSVAISKDLKNVAQICSRYNHTVSGCDNVYNSNLDNIAEGLTDAFNRDFGLSLKKGKSIELVGFYVHGGKYCYYSHEINGHKISENCIDGELYNPDTHLIFDNYILDIKSRKIRTIDKSVDAFVDEVQKLLDKGYKIVVKRREYDESEDDDGKIVIYKR